MTIVALTAVGCAYFMWAELVEVKGFCMAAWTRLDERRRDRGAERRERDNLIRRLARAEAAMDGLRSIATEAAMLAQLDDLRADSCWAPLHDELSTEQV